MTTRVDPRRLGGVVARTFGAMIPPGEGAGIVIDRQTEMLQEEVAVGRSGQTFVLRYTHWSHEDIPKLIELTSSDYNEFVGGLNGDHLRKMGGVLADAEAMDGECYLVKYVDEAGIDLVMLGNPRESADQEIIACADALDFALQFGMTRTRGK